MLTSNRLSERTKVRPLTILLSIIVYNSSYGQTLDSTLLEHKKFVYSISDNCFDSLEWFELKLPNKTVEEKINVVIKEAMLSKQLDTAALQEICDDADLPDNEKLHKYFDVAFGIFYTQNQIFSCIIRTDEYFGGGSHPHQDFIYFNFDLTNGKQFNFHDLMLNDSVTTIDSLIIQKLKQEESLRHVDEGYFDAFRNQLQEVRFWIDGLGITLRFEGKGNELYDQRWSFSELKRFIKKDGAMKKVYEKTN